jgi:hypothetical protein
MAGLLDFIQGASNAAAGTISGPIDLLSLGLRKAGVPLPAAPFGGSQWMQDRGLTREPQNRMAGLLGESFGNVLPIAAAAKTPQIAGGLLQMGENMRAPMPMNAATRGQAGAIVYHGTPHKFDKFDASKIGTGEGAQAYGHGLYFAENPSVAQGYRNPAGNTAYTVDGKNAIDAAYADRTLNRPVRYLQDFAGNVQAAKKAAIDDGFPDLAADIQKLSDAGRIKPAPAGSLYKVDLPDEHIAKMLDYDKPINQQSSYVKKALERAGINFESSALAGPMAMGQEAHLQKHGIPGIRYLDGGSRKTNAGTSNYVVFPGNEGLLSILGRE